jgi:hypothetical protein
MKSVFILAFSLAFFFNPVFSQQKLDYVWPLGYGPEFHPPSGIVQGGILMDFNDTPPSLSLHSFISESQKAGICDATGQILAYTDGCSIYNKEHTIMLNGDSLNPGKLFEEFCSSFPSYPLYQGCLFLPKPGEGGEYCLFHLRKDDWLWNPMDLMYSILDATGDSGKGEVIVKNQIVFSDSIWLGSYISATRHANGRDWWVVVPQRVRPGFHVSLLTSQGVEYKGLQIFGDTTCPSLRSLRLWSDGFSYILPCKSSFYLCSHHSWPFNSPLVRIYMIIHGLLVMARTNLKIWLVELF